MAEIQNINDRKWEIAAACGVLLLSAVIAFWMLSEKVLDGHECFVSVTAREMLQSGDWILPTCNGGLRINKTPLSYWLVGITAEITGRVDNFSARLPSAVFAVLSAAAILYFINRLLNFRTAVISTAVWATSLAYIRGSHWARPDMALVFFVMLCLLSFYAAVNAESRRRQVIYALVFWISFALGNLAKGPAPIPFVLIPLVFYVALFRQWKLLPKLLPVVGPLIFLAIFLPWPLAIADRVNWNLLVWKREFFDRLFGDYAPGRYPVYFYLLMMFRFVTPWVFFLPMTLTAPFYKVWGKKQPLMKFLWLWFVTGFAFLTVDVCRRQHYILPLMPAMAILIGILLEDVAFTRAAYTRNFAKNILKTHVIIAVAGTFVAAGYFAFAMPRLLTSIAALGAVTIIAAFFTALLFIRNKPAFACAVIFIGITAWFMISNSCFLPFLDINRSSRDFAETVARMVPQSDKLISYKGVPSEFVHYFGKTVPSINDKSQLHDYYQQGYWVVGVSERQSELARDNRFERVYYKENVTNDKNNDTGAALFHKIAPLAGKEASQ